MTKISADDVKKLAALSALQVSDQEITSLQAELEQILSYVAQLDKVETSGLKPTYQVTGLKNVTRSDEFIDYGVSKDELLKNAPEVNDGQIKVKRVLT